MDKEGTDVDHSQSLQENSNSKPEVFPLFRSYWKDITIATLFILFGLQAIQMNSTIETNQQAIERLRSGVDARNPTRSVENRGTSKNLTNAVIEAQTRPLKSGVEYNTADIRTVSLQVKSADSRLDSLESDICTMRRAIEDLERKAR